VKNWVDEVLYEGRRRVRPSIDKSFSIPVSTYQGSIRDSKHFMKPLQTVGSTQMSVQVDGLSGMLSV